MSDSRPSIFPPDGDVLIMSPMGKQWKVHSWKLIHVSSVLGALLKDVSPRTVTKAMRTEGTTVRWWIEMKPFAAFDDPRFRDFECVPMSKKGKLNLNGAGAYNGIGDVPFEKTYDNLFKMMYSLTPDFTDDVEDGANGYITDCVSVLQAAEYLNALPSVRPFVESYLLRISQKFWVHVAKAPEAWSDIACSLQSAIIFRESIIHIAGGLEIPGQIKKSRFANTRFGKVCLETAERKALELREKKLEVERRLSQYYPERLIRRETPDKIPGRADYGSDIYYWQALIICRQFFQSAILANRHHRHEDGGVEFYRTVFRCDYVDKHSADEFHQLFAMSTKGKQCLAEAVESIKDDHRIIIAELLEDNLQLRTTVRSKPLRYLTCINIAEEELPWIMNPNLYAGSDPGQGGDEDEIIDEGSMSPERGPAEVMSEGEALSPERVPGEEVRFGEDAMGMSGEERLEADAEEDEGEPEYNEDESAKDEDEDEYMEGA
ncbi:hypothetical protein SBOR_1263 [Sclerotinia borealis F-4128]|uniref:BTB domain-containing protein n=1 Tax=Sclerotinia borealis (strain F-4128) TaxID=1432307 RepID=W9CV49_SCLBF|nr:hypothetical protein SBOR_1263 [Sclerotinia borealis F-4128]